jgi:hypothetical protein
MTFYNKNEKDRLALASKRAGVSEEFFTALLSAANVPDNASIDHAFAKVRHFLAKKLLPAIYLDKEQFPFYSETSATDSVVVEEAETVGEFTDTAVLLESVERLRHEYSMQFGLECFASPNLSLLEEIHLLEDAIETGRPYVYCPVSEDE